MTAIRLGKIDDAIELITKHFPSCLETNPQIHALLLSQKFIEFLRNNETLKSIEFAQSTLTSFADIKIPVVSNSDTRSFLKTEV